MPNRDDPVVLGLNEIAGIFQGHAEKAGKISSAAQSWPALHGLFYGLSLGLSISAWFCATPAVDARDVEGVKERQRYLEQVGALLQGNLDVAYRTLVLPVWEAQQKALAAIEATQPELKDIIE